MNFEEYAAKPLLAGIGIEIPRGQSVETPDEAAEAAEEVGPAVVIKAQVPTGKRGKAGGILIADTPEEARVAAEKILGMDIAGYTVKRLLVEERAAIAREFYAAVINDAPSKGPMVLFSTLGGMDIEEAADTDPDQIRRHTVDIRKGFDPAAAEEMLAGLDLGKATTDIAWTLAALYTAYRQHDAELLEINPLALLEDGGIQALDCKFVLDDSAAKRQETLITSAAAEPMTDLETRATKLSLKYIELDGDIGVLANGAGLTMTTMDVIEHHGGKPANFLEIGGEAYTLAKPALQLALDNPRVKCLIINFCGAFARTDVMIEGIIDAWEDLKPTLPVFFSVRGTGEDEAVAMLKARLGIEPFETMDGAIKAAVLAAQQTVTEATS